MYGETKPKKLILGKWRFWVIGGILFSVVLISILGGRTQPTKDKQVGSLYHQYSSPSTTIVPPSPNNCINYTKVGKHVGEYTCIVGKIDHVYTSRKGNNFLDFCANYKTCPFSAVIFNSDAYKFSNIKGYNGRTVEITGLIKTYKGRAEIIINDPSQIKIK